MPSTVRTLHAAVRSLKHMPQRGRIGQTPGTRELVMVPLPYIVVYGVEPDMVHVFRFCTHQKIAKNSEINAGGFWL